MRLSHLSIRNYRCFEELADLPLETITAFIGPNDSGKSSILHLLRSCFLNEPLSENDFRNPGSTVVVEMSFNVSRASEAENAQDFMHTQSELRVLKEFSVGSRPVSKVFQNCYQDERLNRIDNLSMQELNALIADHNISGRFSTNEQRRQAVRDFVEANGAPMHDAWMDADPRLGSVLPEYILFGADEDLNLQAGPLITTLRQVYRSFLNPPPEEIRSLLTQAREKLQQEIEGLNPILQQFVPNGSTLVINPQLDISNSLNIGEIRLRTEADEIVPFSCVGDGTKRRIMLGVFHWANQIFSKMAEEEGRSLLWGFDEPDTHLHYEAQYELLTSMQVMAESRMQILLCTHSIPIIDRLPTQMVRHMVPNRESRCTHIEYVENLEDTENVSDFLSSVGHGLGFPNSLLFYERCFLLVEGATEEKALPILYQKAHGSSMLGDGIRLFAAESDGAVLQLMRLLHHQGRSVVALLDSDVRGKHGNVVDRLQAEGIDVDTYIQYVGACEFEDAFPNEAIVGCLNEHYPRSDGAPWCVDHVSPFRSDDQDQEESRSKFSHTFLNVEVPRASRKKLTKPEFGRQLANHIEGELIPAEILQLFDIARNVARN